MHRFIWPFVILLVLTAFLAVGLHRDPREIPSPLIGKPAPQFTVSQLSDPASTFSPTDMRGQVWLLNVWASWCVACREEHPDLIRLAGQNIVPMIGLNYKDVREDGVANLRAAGNPYRLSAYDPQGKVGLDYGVYGVPETFVIDRRGIIRKKFIGPLTPALIDSTLLPLLKELNLE